MAAEAVSYEERTKPADWRHIAGWVGSIAKQALVGIEDRIIGAPDRRAVDIRSANRQWVIEHEDLAVGYANQLLEQDMPATHDQARHALSSLARLERIWMSVSDNEQSYPEGLSTRQPFNPKQAKSLLYYIEEDRLLPHELRDIEQIQEWVTNDRYAVYFDKE